MASAKNARPMSALDSAWVALTHRLAAIVGSSTGLISLLWGASALQASLRGGLAWLAVGLLSRATAWLLAQTAQGGES